MRLAIIKGVQFYVDDVTEELSRKYDVKQYKTAEGTTGDFSDERFLGRIMALQRFAGKVVGIDFMLLTTAVNGLDYGVEKQIDSPSDAIAHVPLDFSREDLIQVYSQIPEMCLGGKILRTEKELSNFIFYQA